MEFLVDEFGKSLPFKRFPALSGTPFDSARRQSVPASFATTLLMLVPYIIGEGELQLIESHLVFEGCVTRPAAIFLP